MKEHTDLGKGGARGEGRPGGGGGGEILLLKTAEKINFGLYDDSSTHSSDLHIILYMYMYMYMYMYIDIFCTRTRRVRRGI